MVDMNVPNQNTNLDFVVPTDVDTNPEHFNDLIQQEIPNLYGEVELFWSEDRLRNNRYKDIFDGKKVIGYENGIKPIFIEQENSDGGIKTNAQKLEEIFNIVTYSRETIQERQNSEAIKQRRDETGMVYTTTKDGKVFDVDLTQEEEQGFFKNVLGEILPFVDSDNEKLNRKRYEMELKELGLTPQKAKELREQLSESHYYLNKEGKVAYHEETKDLSYLMPDMNDYSVAFQARQILGNITDDFPAMITGLYSTVRTGIAKAATEPDKSLISPYHKKNIFGMPALNFIELAEGKEFLQDEEGRFPKSPAEFESDIQLYKSQKEQQLAYIDELTSYFDEKKHTESMWASFKNLHKNIVYNNTGFELTEEMMKNFENPTDSFLYHVTDIVFEGLPYIAVIEGAILGYGLKGTMLADDAAEFALKNTGNGLKFSNPMHAVNHYLKEYVSKNKLYSDKQRNKFIKKTLTRLEERQTSVIGLKNLRISLKKEISSYEDQIIAARAKGDIGKVKSLEQAQKALIKNEAGLTYRYFTKSQKSLAKNETFAAVFGGIGRDLFGDNLIAVGFELTGAFTEPFITQHGMKYIARTAAIHSARFFDSIPIINGTIAAQPIEWLKSKSLALSPEQMRITDKTTGLTRNLTTKEVAGVKQFTDILRELPAEQRIEMLDSMKKADEAFNALTKNLSDEDKVELNFTLGQYSGLVALQAIEEIHRIKVDASSLTPESLLQSNEYIRETAELLTGIDKSMANILGKNPGNPEIGKFATNLQENLDLIKETVDAKNSEYLEALESMMDLQKNVNIFDDADMAEKNLSSVAQTLEQLQKNGFSEDVKATAQKLLDDLDEDIIKNFNIISKSLKGDGSNYQIGGFKNVIKGMSESYRYKYKEAYRNLYAEDKNFTVDFTTTIEDIMGGMFPIEKRFGKFKDVTGLLANKLPPIKETDEFINVLKEATKRNTLEFISSVKDKNFLYDAFVGEVPDSIKPILAKTTPLNDIDAKQVFDALANDLIKNNKNYKNIDKSSISGIDIRDLLSNEGANIPVKVNLQEAMDIRSALGNFQFAAVQKNEPKLFTWKELGDKVEKSIFDSIEKSGNTNLAEKYVEANNLYRDYNGRFNNKRFIKLMSWLKTTEGGTLLKQTQNEAGDSTAKIERITVVDEQATDYLKNSFHGGVDDVVAQATHEIDPNKWVDWGKLLSDEKYADDFMRNVITPLVGKRDMEAAAGIGSDINYIIDLADPQIVEKLEAVRGFLNEGIANYIRKNTEAGRTAIGPKNVKKILGENQIGKKGTIKVKSLDLNDNNQITFTIFGKNATGNGVAFKVINLNQAVQLNLAIDSLMARNRFIADIAQSSNKKLSQNYKKSKKFISEEVKQLNKNIKRLEDTSIVANFGTKLSDSQTFVQNIIEQSNDLSNYNKLKRLVTREGYEGSLIGDVSAKISVEEFDKVTKELFSDYFYKRFTRPIRGKGTDVVNGFDAVGAKNYLQTNQKNLKAIYGEKHYNEMVSIMDVVLIKTGIGKTDVTDVSRYPTSLSLESLMSRLYAINRGVISTRYVLSEIALRRFQKNKGSVLKAILYDPDFATVVKNVLESDDIYKNPEINTKLEKLLNENVMNAVFLREGSEMVLEHREEKQDKLLNEMNQEMIKFKEGMEQGYIR